MQKKPIIHHCEDLSLTKDGEMNEGEVARPDAVFLAAEAYPRSWKKSKPE